jgi:hypothetical protein
MTALTRDHRPGTVWVPQKDGTFRPDPSGVTHYLFDWRDHIVGEGLRLELIAAGLPGSLHVTAYPGPDGTVVDVSIPGDDGGKLAGKVEKFLDAHKGTEAPDHLALVEYAGAISEVAQRMAEGGQVSDAERDIVLGVLAGRLV